MQGFELEVPLFVIAIVANLSLAVIVWRYAAKDNSRLFFVLFTLAQVFWIGLNYLAFIVPFESFLLLARLTIFSAPFHSFAFYLFVKSIQTGETKYDISKHWLVFTALVTTALINLTPITVSSIDLTDLGTRVIHYSYGVVFFGVFIGYCVLGGVVHMVRQLRKSSGEFKSQWQFLLWGLSFTFVLVLFFSFLSPVLFGNLEPVRFGHVFTFPFIAFSAYAMVKHKLFNIKVLLAELAVVLLNFILVIQLVNSDTLNQRLIGVFVLLGTLTVGYFLVRGVKVEVEQRALYEKISKQLEQANNKLKILDKARVEFISIASHQLRTPPATMKWYLSAIIGGDFGVVSKEVKEQMMKVRYTNEAQISLIDDLLNVSRIERGKLEFYFEPTDVVKMCEDTYNQLVPLAQIKNLKVVFQKPSKPVSVVCDKEKVRQVVNNFIDNSIKYSSSGTITVSVEAKNGGVVVKVTDQGKGIEPKFKDSLFQKYNRGSDSAAHAAGLGLGLYVAKVIIEQHGGKIWAESPGVNKGSSFCFSLPAQPPKSVQKVFDLTKQ